VTIGKAEKPVNVHPHGTMDSMGARFLGSSHEQYHKIVSEEPPFDDVSEVTHVLSGHAPLASGIQECIPASGVVPVSPSRNPCQSRGKLKPQPPPPPIHLCPSLVTPYLAPRGIYSTHEATSVTFPPPCSSHQFRGVFRTIAQ